MLTSHATIVEKILRERGPMESTPLLQAARRAGAQLTAASLDDLLHDAGELPFVVCMARGRHGLADSLLSGRVLTHRLGETEIAHDVLVADPDLLPLGPLLDVGSDMLDLPGGTVEWVDDVDSDREAGLADADFDSDDVIALPAGTLSDFAAGTVVSVRLTPDGAQVVAAEPGIAPRDLGDRIRAARLDLTRDRERDLPRGTVGGSLPMPIDTVDLVMELCAADPGLFAAPLPPLGDLLRGAGFQTIDGDVADAEVDPDLWRATKDAAGIAMTYGIPAADALAVAAISSRVVRGTELLFGGDDDDDDDDDEGTGDEGDEWSDVDVEEDDIDGDDIDGDDDDLDGDDEIDLTGVDLGADLGHDDIVEMTAPLANPATAEALLDQALGVDREPAVMLGAMMQDWEPIAPRRARVALRWIRAACHERLGDAVTAEADLEVARSLDPDWPPVLRDLARYADDRGDVERAISLLHRAGVPAADDDLTFLQGLSSPARGDLGRNQPCWCGSGRKYKVCHLGREPLPIGARATWLYRKMVRFATDGPHRYLILDLVHRRAAHDDGDDAVQDALQDPLLMDAVLFENGAAHEFLHERGFLLPADERAMAEMWLLADCSVYAVEEIRVGTGFTVRDLRTGDRVDVQERSASRQVRRDMRLLMRVLPVGDAWQLFGGLVALPRHMEERALQLCDELDEGTAGPQELVSFAASRFAPPVLNTTDGEPMVFCTARYRVDDVVAVTAELDRRFGSDGDGHWTRTDGEGEHPTVLGSMELDGTELTATAMNDKRFEWLQRELGEVEGLTLLGVERKPAAEMMRDARKSAAGDDQDSRRAAADRQRELQESPEVQALMEKLALDYEAKWLDTSLPALGGATPREAAEDPTRRDELIRLLDSFEDYAAEPGTMQPARLRAALGL